MGETMEFNSIHNNVDRWFVEASARMMYVSANDVDDALAEQENLEKLQRRSIRIWEVLVLLRRLSIEQVDHILETLGKTGPAKPEEFSTLGRVLIEVGYASKDEVLSALRAQHLEREKGEWRMLGQILVERRVTLKAHLQEALDVLEVRRRSRKE